MNAIIKLNKYIKLYVIMSLSLLACVPKTTQSEPDQFLQISGVYPHLAVFNPMDQQKEKCNGNGNECGIGAVVPWADKLWLITYSPHCPKGSADKLYTIDKDLNLEIRPESVGGTPANRMIHMPSNQLLIGPYLISDEGNVRVIDPQIMPGRLTATAQHLTDPDSMVYYYDMEGMLYEANVYSLKVNKLFHKPVPGWHGKGGYTSQGRLVIANNGEHKVFDIDHEMLQAGGAPQSDEDMGALAEWDGGNWRIVARKQFTDVTGPGGIYGAENENSPLWSIGWDKRSVILKLLDNGTWYTFRLPKSTHTYDHWGGWYTEWPRIREIGQGKMLMDMHGMFYEFPKGFVSSNTKGIKPLANHLRYVPDFCQWNGQLVLATDETSILQNHYAGRSQSNFWFGNYDEIKEWGPTNGYGGVWLNDEIKANEFSLPYLLNGFDRKMVHLAHSKSQAIFTFEIDKEGNGEWEKYKEIEINNHYGFYIFPDDMEAAWIRVKANIEGVATAYFHYTGTKQDTNRQEYLFQALAGVKESTFNGGMIRPAGHNGNLQYLANDTYYEIDEKLNFINPEVDRSEEVAEICEFKKEFEIDDSSIIVRDKSGTFRLPKTSRVYDHPFPEGWPRGRRELESERYMFQVHGTFFEVPREAGFTSMRPITTHKKKIMDFCTWRGLLVLSGTNSLNEQDGHYFSSDQGEGLWFGAIDDLWKLGKPVGKGGVWKETQVKAGEPSLPYLMTGYDKKKVTITSNDYVTFTIEVDFDHNGWRQYKQIEVPGGNSVTYEFPEGFSAHWVRVTANKDCLATALFVYE
ncbi:hypothetical protein QQ020_19885 [Fulvivirgaceae bacterium BMA12]|uniref:Uncharacterized protein n=1 Tax=Agaribacillus aureus TaxID=3051825 RepID=A0ABT8L9C3_9BACT|nr:hypothetical protein [Fulvivirgaceae bacterium BMA12]